MPKGTRGGRGRVYGPTAIGTRHGWDTWFNPRRYGNPWVARVGDDAKPDFNTKVGHFKAEESGGMTRGELIVTAPKEGEIYMFGQKDKRGSGSIQEYAVFRNGSFQKISKSELEEWIRKRKGRK